MTTSHVNLSLHSGIIQAIREISADRGGRGYFVNTLEQIISDLQEQITVDDVRDPGASASRICRRPETPVMDSFGLWNAYRTTHLGCWWVNCSSHFTINLIEKIFAHGLSDVHEDANITWGTLLRYFNFIHLEIYENVDGDDVVAEMEEAVTAHSIVDKFNNEEEESMNTLTGERAWELGYFIAPVGSFSAWTRARVSVLRETRSTLVPRPEQTTEQTTTQRTNESVRKLQNIIDSLSRGEKFEINEGEYLQLSDYLKRSFVSQ